MIKSRRMAYDGKGNAVAKTAEDVAEAVEKLGGFDKGLYCERWVPFARELAVMVIRSKSGETKAYPVTETVHAAGYVSQLTPPHSYNPPPPPPFHSTLFLRQRASHHRSPTHQ